jgi:hypothetical protein
MRCRRSLRGNDPKPLQNCIREAEGCGIHAMEKICSVTPTSPAPHGIHISRMGDRDGGASRWWLRR